MAPEQQMARDTFKVGRFTCEMTIANGGCRTRWEPHFPPA